MTDNTNRYYEEELNYLLEAGREYARVHSERARFLNLSDPRSRDPHVERLVESFAFLTGNIRQKLDDDFPELTHSLLQLVWPYHLRPIPAIAILEFRPHPKTLRGRQTIPRGFLVESLPVAEPDPSRTPDDAPPSKVACRFRTAYDVNIEPFHLAEAGFVIDEGGSPSLRLAFQLEEGADRGKLHLDRLRFHLAGETAVTFALYRILRQQVGSILLRYGKDSKRLLTAKTFQPVGFGAEEEVLPYPSISFPGFRLLSEYFCFPEKFLFLDLAGIGAVPLDPKEDRFEIEIRLNGKIPDSLHPTADNFRLFATPVVNIFPRSGEPITVTQLRTRYRVLGDFTHPEAYEVFSVDSVESLRPSDGARFRRPPFFSFEHDEAGNVGNTTAWGEKVEKGVYHHVTHRRTTSGHWLTNLSLISKAGGRLPGEEVLSLELTCTNGRLCREVGLEEITRTAAGRLDFATFGNITRPTDPVYPRLGAGTEWRFISQMALNFRTLSDPATLRALLSLYDVGDLPANRRRIESIQGARTAPREILDRGTPVRGTALTLDVDESRFDDAGDLLLFGEVLSEFFSLYSGINSFTELTLRQIPSGEVLRCSAVPGRRAPI